MSCRQSIRVINDVELVVGEATTNHPLDEICLFLIGKGGPRIKVS